MNIQKSEVRSQKSEVRSQKSEVTTGDDSLVTAHSELFPDRRFEFPFFDLIDKALSLIASDQWLNIIARDFFKRGQQAFGLRYSRELQVVLEKIELLGQIERLITLGVLDVEQRHFLRGNSAKNLFELFYLWNLGVIEPRLAFTRASPLD